MAEHQKYKVTERIDAGGMAEVFRGVAESLHGFKKAVAIKRILPNLTKKQRFVAMFLDEAKLSLHLQHANIVQVFDIGVADNTYFIVMEYIDGANLRLVQDSLRRQGRRLKIEHALYLMMEVCKGLAYAHDMHDPETGKPLGIVHRDISPSNILISRQGEVKLVDFGLAKATSQLENTEPGVVKGKFSYLSPEAAEGRDVDHRSDIFAVGILLFEMITGRRLFYGDNDYETVQLVRQARIPSIQALNPEVEPALEQVIRKALARDVVERHQQAADMQDALAQYLFSRAMKVTSRDIATLVQECLREKERSAPAKQKTSNIIDALIQEEIVKFTSLGEDSAEVEAPEGSRPLTPEEISGPQNPASGEMIDPRSWGLDEILESSKGDGLLPASRTGRDGGAARPANSATPPRVATPIPAGGRSTGQASEPAPPARSTGKMATVPAPPARSTGKVATVPAPPARSTGKVPAQQQDLELLETMAEPSTDPKGTPVPTSQPAAAASPSRRRVGLYVAIAVLLILALVVVALAVKVGLIGGHPPRPPA
jgi:serine/threonine-protein kinase